MKVVLILFALYFCSGVAMATDNNVIISSPLRGSWTIYNPPGHAPQAFDLLAVDEEQSLYIKGSFTRHLLTFIEVTDTWTWASEVYSPVDGEVVSSLNSVKDRTSISFLYDLISMGLSRPDPKDGFGAFGGNHILIRADGFYVLLCHLKQGSITVQAGEKLQVGQKIAQVGNSGSSIQPHLHLQVMKDENIFPLFENLIPFKIASGEVMNNNTPEQKVNFSLEDRAYYQF